MWEGYIKKFTVRKLIWDGDVNSEYESDYFKWIWDNSVNFSGEGKWIWENDMNFVGEGKWIWDNDVNFVG